MTPNRTGLLTLTSPGARAIVWLYFTTNAILAVWTIGGMRVPWHVALALVLVGALALAITFDTHEQLSLPVTIAALLVGPLNAALLSWDLLYVGYNSWFIGVGAATLFLVCIRGRIALAWLGFAILTAVMLIWGASDPIGIGSVAVMMARQALVLTVGTMFAIGLKRTEKVIDKLTRAAAERAAAEAAGVAESTERARRHAELAESVAPLLERIASGEPLSAADRREFAVAEAELRDSLRARGLRIPVVTEATRAARRRGVDVVLLDDSGTDAPDSELAAFAAVIAEALDGTFDGRVTARLLPPGRPVMGTVVADGSHYVKHEVARGA